MTATCGWPVSISHRHHKLVWVFVFSLKFASGYFVGKWLLLRKNPSFLPKHPEDNLFNSTFAFKIRGLGRILAIDYGTKRTGLAITDPGQMIASPLGTVATHELMKFLESYFGNEEVETLVVGQPRKLDKSDSDPMRPLRYFVQAFKKRFPKIRVEWMDERFTSKMAVEAMVEGGMKRSDRRVKGNVDKVSASLILQLWLERRNNLSG